MTRDEEDLIEWRLRQLETAVNELRTRIAANEIRMARLMGGLIAAQVVFGIAWGVLTFVSRSGSP